MMLAAFPDTERGKALGTHLSVVGLGAIAGPAMGGFLVAWLGWEWVFFVNVPAGGLVLALSWLLLERDAGASQYRRDRDGGFDWTGAAVSGVILLVLLVVVGNGNGLGWRSAPVIGGGIAVVLLMGFFIWWELRTRAPMLDLRLFANRIFGIGAAAAWLSFFRVIGGAVYDAFLPATGAGLPTGAGRLDDDTGRRLHGYPGAFERAAVGPFRLAGFYRRRPVADGGRRVRAGLCLAGTLAGVVRNRYHDDAKLRHRPVQLAQQQQHYQRG